ncbi:hypothetical protein MXMO3_02740 [Maritalea myrionectae]|uniref:Antitoxin SocA-like Panacea domain-containing protein n=1 Tax=Maritalea myrionectae TaxID=454601 RepID=A0A2R4MGS6_9HYPH|nr:type II toxin-antitoxin system antitoxin SocA domain-containing protein [Maritalea myrionectae]AVX05251.1 hypothetical protein MXMO3_02740 [Maritalea myrionectae]
MNDSAIDPRIVANLFIERSRQDGFKVTNLSLQKLIYFAHGMFLLRHNSPLVSGYFEAWQYGPVHPLLYRELKSNGRQSIVSQLVLKDIFSGEVRELAPPKDPAILEVVDLVVERYAKLPASLLVSLSHAPGSPWAVVVDKARTGVAIGGRISDELIKERFRFHLSSVSANSMLEPEFEDCPIKPN